MLNIDRNTRGLRDSLAVRSLGKIDEQHRMTFTLATPTRQLATVF